MASSFRPTVQLLQPYAICLCDQRDQRSIATHPVGAPMVVLAVLAVSVLLIGKGLGFFKTPAAQVEAHAWLRRLRDLTRPTTH